MATGKEEPTVFSTISNNAEELSAIQLSPLDTLLTDTTSTFDMSAVDPDSAEGVQADLYSIMTYFSDDPEGTTDDALMHAAEEMDATQIAGSGTRSIAQTLLLNFNVGNTLMLMAQKWLAIRTTYATPYLWIRIIASLMLIAACTYSILRMIGWAFSWDVSFLLQFLSLPDPRDEHPIDVELSTESLDALGGMEDGGLLAEHDENHFDDEDDDV